MNWTCFFQSSFHDKFTVIACSYFYSTALDLSNITEFCSESKGSINWNLLISLLLLSFFNCVLEQVPTQKQQSCLFHTFGTLCPHRNCRWEENVRLLNIVLLVFLLSLCKFWFFFISICSWQNVIDLISNFEKASVSTDLTILQLTELIDLDCGIFVFYKLKLVHLRYSLGMFSVYICTLCCHCGILNLYYGAVLNSLVYTQISVCVQCIRCT